ncbi:MAG TPA: hypothetical protein VFH68_12450 [Polyangia bacterium]|nr:hypothetical protein [Polyangia bacterium]
MPPPVMPPTPAPGVPPVPVRPPAPVPGVPPTPAPGVPPVPVPVQLAAQLPLLHRVWPAAQPQVPLLQTLPAPQAMPQPLQLLALVLVSTQLPLHEVVVPLQADEHWPELQTWAPAQALVQLPQ